MTGARERIVINAAWGLGEAVVGGHVTPDTIVVDRVSGEVVARQVADKRVMTVAAGAGTREEPVPDGLRTRPALAPEQAARLARLAVRTEELCDTPMDVEWAMRDSEPFVVQARPITVVRGEEWNDSLRGDRLWTNANLGEAIPDVMTPCTWSVVRRFMTWAMATSSVPGLTTYGNIGGRFYFDLSMSASPARAFGVGRRLYQNLIRDVSGALPPGWEIPPVPVSRLHVLRRLVPAAARRPGKRIRAITEIRLFPSDRVVWEALRAWGACESVPGVHARSGAAGTPPDGGAPSGASSGGDDL